METRNDNAGVRIPPPLIYAAVFCIAILLQKYIILPRDFFKTAPATILGCVAIAAGLGFALPAIIKFFQTKNTLVTVKPANSLQTSGIYSMSRNPMYIGLLLVYTGLAFLFGNWWNFILIPVLVIIVTQYIIRREEGYLQRAFGEAYANYRKKVRRWL